jgi:hypothetical protein
MYLQICSSSELVISHIVRSSVRHTTCTALVQNALVCAMLGARLCHFTSGSVMYLGSLCWHDNILCHKCGMHMIFVLCSRSIACWSPRSSDDSLRFDMIHMWVAHVSLLLCAQIPALEPLKVVISGPSGVGKDAVIKALQAARPELHFVVTATSRSVCKTARPLCCVQSHLKMRV